MSRRSLTRNPALLALALVLLAGGVLLLVLTRHLTFFQDTWEFLMSRRYFTAETLFQPHNEHIVVIPVLLQQLELHLFGMDSARPEYVLLTVSVLATAALMYVYVSRRLGPWPGVIAAAVLLFLGPAWQDILWPFEIGFVGSVLFGIAMLLALEREERGWDIAACVFLVIAVGFSSLGLAFLVGAAVDVLQKRRRLGLGRAYVAAIPLLLYAAWWLGWGHKAETHLSLHNVLGSPLYVMEALAASVAAVFGLSSFDGAEIQAPAWGPALVVALIVLVVWRQLRRPGFYPGLWPAVATAATAWFLGGFNFIPGREAYVSRYLFAGAAFVLLIGANLLQGVRIGRRALVVAGVVALAAIASNLVLLDEGHSWLEDQTALTRADTGAIEIAKETVEPSFGLTPEIAGTPTLIDVRADKYLQAVREYGSPAYTPAELAMAPEAARHQADVVLAHALPVTIYTEPGLAGAEGGGNAGGAGAKRSDCQEVQGGPASAEVALSPGVTSIELGPGEPATIHLRRFATGANYPLTQENVPGESTTLLEIPHDLAPNPWYLKVEAAQPATVCR